MLIRKSIAEEPPDCTENPFRDSGDSILIDFPAKSMVWNAGAKDKIRQSVVRSLCYVRTQELVEVSKYEAQHLALNFQTFNLELKLTSF